MQTRDTARCSTSHHLLQADGPVEDKLFFAIALIMLGW